MLLGDTHGNTKFIKDEVIPAAVAQGITWIYQVGDFGYWEHTSDGVLFLDDVNTALAANGLQLVFIQGNHDKVSMIPGKYNETLGFYKVRSLIWFAPNGTVWSPDDGVTNFIALGGAYSVDKDDRLKMERNRAKRLYGADAINDLFDVYRSAEQVQGSLWFPEEEMTELEFKKILESTTERVDVVLAHDKPLSSNPGVNLLNIDECIPNQRRLQQAITSLKPKLFIHGHLHIRYSDIVRCGDDNAFTKVEGLGADVPNFNQRLSSWEPSDAWEFLTLGE